MKLIFPDYLVILGILLFASCHVATNYLLTSYTTTAEKIGVAEDVVAIYESNPIARWFFKVDALKLIYGFVVMPSLVVGLYWLVRRKGVKESTEAMAITIVMMGVMNFLNDFSILLGFFASH